MLIPGKSGSFPLKQDQIQKVIIEKRPINKELDKVLTINVFVNGLRKIWNIKLIIIMPILINKDCSALNRKKYDTLLFLTSPIKIAKNNNKFPKGMDLSIIIIGIAGI